jgi:hypothetical protein
LEQRAAPVSADVAPKSKRSHHAKRRTRH